MRFAICNELFEGWDFRRVVEFVSGLGYDGLELAPFTLAEDVTTVSATQRRELRQLAADHGLALVGLHWLLAKPAGLHLTHPDNAVRSRTIVYLQRLIDLCADLGGSVMVFGSPHQRSLLPGVSRSAGWQAALDGFAVCAPLAQARGVTLCLEALPADLTSFLNTNREVIDLVRAIDHPAIQMMVDVKSMASEALPIAENIRACHGWFHHVHANDANAQGPGFGKIDFRPILQALHDLRYGGYVSVEVFDFTPGPEVTARRSLDYLKSVLSQINGSEIKP